ncbi:MAG: response regulator [Thermodesulfovibrionales bacterium]|nr:response regulator [Thermodesulfovibrionales bacterium]
MSRKLNILNLEDNEYDTALTEKKLRKRWKNCQVTRVDTRKAFIEEIRKNLYDLVLADYSLPSFDGLTALKITRKKNPDIPFIFVTGVLGEEKAIETLKKGVTDYVLKDRLSRLVPAVHRALSEFDEKAKRKKAEESEHRRTDQILLNHAALLELSKTKTDDLEKYLKLVTIISAQILGIERVSIWFSDKKSSEFHCADLYLLSSHVHEKGRILQADRYPRYLQALEENRMLAADDAMNDPRTNELSEHYLKPMGIVSMLDVPIRIHGTIAGILCYEHTLPRQWSYEEHQFAASVADIVSLAIEAGERRKAENALEEKGKELKKRVRELENFYEMAVGRELRMIELKKEIKELKAELLKYRKNDGDE